MKIMQDRYLCKAVRKDNGELIQGYLIFDEFDKEYRIIQQLEYSTGTSIVACNAPRVLEATVCRSTGVKDMNGRLIWEDELGKLDEMYNARCKEINKLKKELKEKTEELEDMKSRELILSPGDRVYSIIFQKLESGKWESEIYEAKVTQIILSEKGMCFYAEITYSDGNKQSYEYTQDEINTGVFLTIEEAERVWLEMERVKM